MNFARQIAICFVACVAAIAATGGVLILLLGDGAIDLQMNVPRQAMTAPMIGVVVFWLVGRALRVPLEPVRTFLYGGILVYATLYFSGRLVAVGVVDESLGTALVLLAIVIMGFLAIHRAEVGGP